MRSGEYHPAFLQISGSYLFRQACVALRAPGVTPNLNSSISNQHYLLFPKMENVSRADRDKYLVSQDFVLGVLWGLYDLSKKPHTKPNGGRGNEKIESTIPL